MITIIDEKGTSPNLRNTASWKIEIAERIYKSNERTHTLKEIEKITEEIVKTHQSEKRTLILDSINSYQKYLIITIREFKDYKDYKVIDLTLIKVEFEYQPFNGIKINKIAYDTKRGEKRKWKRRQYTGNW